jgi:hypothetical protein
MSHQQSTWLCPLMKKFLLSLNVKISFTHLKKIPSYGNTKGHVHELKTMQDFEVQMCNENVMGKQ